MTGSQRLEAIKNLLYANKRVVVSDLSLQFSVTEETIRRDLDKLEEEGFLNRTYGGAILNMEETIANIPFYKRAKHNLEEKKIIASKAIKLLESANTIFTDSSSTVMETIKLLKNRENLTIVTNSSEATKELLISEVDIVSTGGMLNKKTLSFQGTLTENAISNYNVEIAVLSCKGLDLSKGVTDTNEVESRIKRAMIRQADKVMILVDEYKFDKKAFVHLMALDKIDYIVTNKRPTQKWINYFKERNIVLLY